MRKQPFVSMITLVLILVSSFGTVWPRSRGGVSGPAPRPPSTIHQSAVGTALESGSTPARPGSAKRLQLSPSVAGTKTGGKRWITIEDGRLFRLKEPAEESSFGSVSIADTPLGILYLLPPGWHRRQSTWDLYLAPVPGTRNIEQDSNRVAVIGGRDSGQWRITALTRQFVLLLNSPPPGMNGEDRLFSVDTYSGRVSQIFSWNPSQANGEPFVVVRGVVAWWVSGTGHAVALDLSSGQKATLAGLSSPSALAVSQGALTVNGKVLSLPFLKPYRHRLLPGYQWAYPHGANRPVIAVPTNWNIITPLSAGTGTELRAHLATNPHERLTVWRSSCSQCFDPATEPGENVIGTDSPLLLSPPATTYTWLSAHQILFVTKYKNGWATYSRSLVSIPAGQLGARVTVPQSQKTVALRILKSLWIP